MSSYLDKAFDLASQDVVDFDTLDAIEALADEAPASESEIFNRLCDSVSRRARDESKNGN